MCNFLGSVAAKTWSDGWTSVTAGCFFFFFMETTGLQEHCQPGSQLSSQLLTLQLGVTAQFYLASKGKYILLEVRLKFDSTQNTRREGKPWLSFGSSFYMFFFFLPLSLSYVNWASQEGCFFHLSFSLQSSEVPLFYFCGLFPFFVF